jgi:hypothetical protein
MASPKARPNKTPPAIVVPFRFTGYNTDYALILNPAGTFATTVYYQLCLTPFPVSAQEAFRHCGTKGRRYPFYRACLNTAIPLVSSAWSVWCPSADCSVGLCGRRQRTTIEQREPNAGNLFLIRMYGYLPTHLALGQIPWVRWVGAFECHVGVSDAERTSCCLRDGAKTIRARDCPYPREADAKDLP